MPLLFAPIAEKFLQQPSSIYRLAHIPFWLKKRVLFRHKYSTMAITKNKTVIVGSKPATTVAFFHVAVVEGGLFIHEWP